MHIHQLQQWQHQHHFAPDARQGERSTRIVVGLTFSMMVIEITAGLLFGSMALLADGWHMGTHVAALGITLFAYRYARRHADNPRYSFGTGKVGELGQGFATRKDSRPEPFYSGKWPRPRQYEIVAVFVSKANTTPSISTNDSQWETT